MDIDSAVRDFIAQVERAGQCAGLMQPVESSDIYDELPSAYLEVVPDDLRFGFECDTV